MELNNYTALEISNMANVIRIKTEIDAINEEALQNLTDDSDKYDCSVQNIDLSDFEL